MREDLQTGVAKDALAAHRLPLVHVLAPLALQQVNDVPNVKVGNPECREHPTCNHC